jgi:hypothetical protein
MIIKKGMVNQIKREEEKMKKQIKKRVGSVGRKLQIIIAKIEEVKKKNNKKKFFVLQKQLLNTFDSICNFTASKSNINVFLQFFDFIKLKPASSFKSDNKVFMIQQNIKSFSIKSEASFQIKLVSCAHHLARLILNLKKLIPSELRPIIDWVEIDEYFLNFSNIQTFLIKNNENILSNSKIYALYVLLRFTHFMKYLVILKTSLYSKRKKIIDDIFSFMGHHANCFTVCKEIHKELKNKDNTRRINNLVLVSFIDDCNTFFWLDDNKILQLIQDRRKKPSRSLDLDDFEIIS